MTDTPANTAPYGSWSSPITTELLTAGSIGLDEVQVDADDIYWIERRSNDGGRSVLVRYRPGGRCVDLTPAPFNVRSRVHEYGGAAYTVRDGLIVFANFDDRRLYLLDTQTPDNQPTPLTPESDFRYAAPELDLRRRRLIAIREDHTNSDEEPVNTLVSLDLDDVDPHGGRVIFTGSDFVSSPTLDADARRLAWITWNHPAMPWDRAILWVADVVTDGSLARVRALTDGRDAVGQPRWAPDGRLFYITEQSGWANITSVDPELPDAGATPLPPLKLEFGLPGSALGSSDYDFGADGRVVCSWWDRGVGRLGVLNPATGALSPVSTAAVAFSSLTCTGDSVVLIANEPLEPAAVSRISLERPDTPAAATLMRSTDAELDKACLSVAEELTWHNSMGLPVHGFFYAPTNGRVTADPAELPPLLVVSHGGPSSLSSPALSLGVQYWTSRGFAVFDVSYGGSTGFGREYRERLRGGWGVVDVDDCATGAQLLAECGRVDSDRLAIRGGSAGGYTTLCALAFTKVFKAGASYFGIGDLEALVRDTHKFESRYVDGLVGPYPAARELYRERSPVHHVERLSSPMILFQGADDEVVPPNQAQSMADALRARGLPVALLIFEGEGHGFRMQANITRALEAELYFYARIFGFTPADPIEPVTIDNLAPKGHTP